MKNEILPKLLRAIAASTEARRLKHDVIFSAAADEIERLRAEVDALRKRSGDGSMAEPFGCPTPGACSCPQ